MSRESIKILHRVLLFRQVYKNYFLLCNPFNPYYHLCHYPKVSWILLIKKIHQIVSTIDNFSDENFGFIKVIFLSGFFIY